jgi:hypothetical protein
MYSGSGLVEENERTATRRKIQLPLQARSEMLATDQYWSLLRLAGGVEQ